METPERSIHARSGRRAARPLLALRSPSACRAKRREEAHTERVAGVVAVEGGHQLLEEARRRLHSTRAPPAVPRQLCPRQLDVQRTDGALLAKSRHLCRPPLEHARKQLRHERRVEGMALGGDSGSKTTHEVPDVQPHRDVRPARIHLAHLRAAIEGAAVAVDVDNRQGRPVGRLVSRHQAVGDPRQTASLRCRHHRDQHLAELIVDVHRPRGRPRRLTCQLLRHLKSSQNKDDTSTARPV